MTKNKEDGNSELENEGKRENFRRRGEVDATGCLSGLPMCLHNATPPDFITHKLFVFQNYRRYFLQFAIFVIS